MFEYFGDKISNNGIMFLQERHSSEDTFEKWQDHFKEEVFFQGTTNFCGVMIDFVRNKNFKCKKNITDTNGRMIIMQAHFDGKKCALINLCNLNNEVVQIKTLCELNQLLGKFYLDSYKVPFARDFNLFAIHIQTPLKLIYNREQNLYQK